MGEVGNILAQALSHHRAGRLDQAERLYREILVKDPGQAEAWLLLGVSAGQRGTPDRAIELIGQSLALRPDHPAALVNLGAVLAGQERVAEAEVRFRQALALRPIFAPAHLRLGLLLKAVGRTDEAEASLLSALALEPDQSEAALALAVLLLERGHAGAAASWCKHAIAVNPTLASAYNILGASLLAERRLEEALGALHHALSLNPDLAEAHNNLGVVFQAKGQPGEAVPCYRRALALRPTYSLAHENLGMSLLSLGHYVEGFSEYDWRTLPSSPGCPRWDGGDPAGQTILVLAEQGLGDTLQFIRYAALLSRRGAHVVVACQPELLNLLAASPALGRVVALGNNAPDAALWVPLLSLPNVFGTTLDTVPGDTPYLEVPRATATFWAERLRSFSGFKVGLVWAGNPYPGNPRGQAIDRRRSVTLAQFAPLASVPGVTLFSLQKGEAADQVRRLSAGFSVVDLMPEVQDFADTAALVAALDLVIGVDTAVIHVAGALARPVWMVSRFDACWRWLTDRDDSPWYPTLRLFRQPEPGAWAPVIDRVVEALTAEVSRLH